MADFVQLRLSDGGGDAVIAVDSIGSFYPETGHLYIADHGTFSVDERDRERLADHLRTFSPSYVEGPEFITVKSGDETGGRNSVTRHFDVLIDRARIVGLIDTYLRTNKAGGSIRVYDVKSLIHDLAPVDLRAREVPDRDLG